LIDPFLLYSVLGAALFCVGLHGLVTRPHLLRKLLALNVMGSAVFLFLVAVAYRNRDTAPDAVPHAMVLTGIVVAVSATAFALALLRRIHALTGRASLDDDGEAEA
jgi:multicomponent Na+:H+ antiporter subunit C